MSDEKQQVGRLAFRVEGDWWVAYFASTDTMQDAIELGRIAMRLVQDQGRKVAFMDIMRSAISDYMQDVFGRRPDDFITRQAPEHERAGRA
jgi:hypothetical protein